MGAQINIGWLFAMERMVCAVCSIEQKTTGELTVVTAGTRRQLATRAEIDRPASGVFGHGVHSEYPACSHCLRAALL
jgi:hypothetical protein